MLIYTTTPTAPMAEAWTLTACCDCPLGMCEPRWDYSSGTVICTECGVVLESDIVDDRPPAEPVTGYLTNYQVTGNALSLVQSSDATKAEDADDGSGKRGCARASAKTVASQQLTDMANMARVSESVVRIALEILFSVLPNKRFKTFQRPILCAACIYNAMLECNVTRTVREATRLFGVPNDMVSFFNKMRKESLEHWALAKNKVIVEVCEPVMCLDRVIGSVGKENLPRGARGIACTLLEEKKDSSINPLVMAAASVAAVMVKINTTPSLNAVKAVADATGIPNHAISHALKTFV